MIGLRGTTAGDGAGVEGVENAADTLLLALNDVAATGDLGAGTDSGTEVRDGGVSGAPKAAPMPGARRVFASSDPPPVGGAAVSRATPVVNFGEKGGVRCRGCERLWLGGDGAAVGGGGAAGCGAAGATVREAACGNGGGHAAAAFAGVRPRVSIGFPPAGVLASAGASVRGTAGIEGRSSPQLTAAPTGMSPPQTEQRARMDTLVIFAGSSRNTERHSGQETFIGTSG